MIRSWQVSAEDAKKLLGRQVIIKYSKKASYHKLKGAIGTVKKVSGSSIGVEIDACPNNSSDYNVWWFTRNELRLCSEEDLTMLNDYEYVACINLVEDSYQRDYYFALFEEDYQQVERLNTEVQYPLVVTNAGGKARRVVGRIKHVMPAADCKYKVTAEVIAVIDTQNYESRVAKEYNNKAIIEKRHQIEAELQKEAEKTKNIDFYKRMASEYPDNKTLQQLVIELEELQKG